VNDEVSTTPALPNGWTWARLEEICSNKKIKAPIGSVPYLEIGDIDISTKKYALEGKPSVAGALFSDKGDILVSRVRPTRGAITIAKDEHLSVSSALTVLRPCARLPSEYVHFCLAWNRDLLAFLGENSTGTMYPTVKEDFVVQYKIPLAPLSEQQRIVAKLEELFTRLDAGVEALKKAKAQLKRYRQSVLKHAFEGKLTAEWREAHKHELEPTSALLDRIRQDRRESRKGKRKELPQLDTSGLPELPAGWVWSDFEELKKGEKNAIKAGPFGSSLKKESYTSQGYKIYGQEQVIRQDASYGNYYVGEDKYMELRSCAAKPGDILVSLVGTIGKALILPEDSEAGIINPRLVKLTLEERLADNKYIKAYIESSAVRDFFTLASHGETMEILNLGILRTLPIPVPSPDEQHRIVEEIERHFSIADQVEKTVDHTLKQAERLRQGILKRAFEGKLVPQDPNDEPAEKLLERIKAEKAERLAEVKAIGKTNRTARARQRRLV
jgi:type I restriction enzyme, S subunit